MKKILTFLCFLALLPSCKKDKEAPVDLFKTYDRKGMLGNIGNNLILPSFESFNNWTDSLTKACIEFTDQPASATLSNAQDKWRTLSAIWKQCELYQQGPLEDQLLLPLIDTWPANSAGIENAITAATTINNTYIQSRTPDVKGLKALEYLLFDRDNGNTAVLNNFTSGAAADKRKAYLIALCNNLHEKALIVYDAWKPSGGNYISTFTNADGNDVASSIGKMTNQMVLLVEKVKNEKTGKPYGIMNGGIPQPSLAEAGRSESSLSHIRDNLRALENTFLGRTATGQDQQGFDDLLNHLGAQYNGQPLSDAIKIRFANAYTKLNAINVPLQDAVITQPKAVEDFYLSVKDLLVLMKVDMVSSLGVLLTFSENDGD